MKKALVRISESVWKLSADSNIYLLLLQEPVVIDTGSRKNRHLVETLLSKLVDFNAVEKVLFTHMHYDHTGNFDLFKNAELFASRQEIEDFKKDPVDTVLNKDASDKLKNAAVKPLPKRISELEVVQTPGHTRGSVCFWYEKEKLLFSGDTLLRSGPGRVDLPTSAPSELQKSLLRLLRYNCKKLCTGHDY